MAEHFEIVISAKDKFSKSFKALGVAAGAATAALGGTAAAVFKIAEATAKSGDEIQKMSLRTGVGAETLSGLKHAAELSGSSIGELGTGLRTLAKRANDSSNGLESASRSFEDLGISATNADGSLKSTDKLLMESADAFANMTDQTKAAALAQELFGRSGTQLLPMLQQGSDAIAEMSAEAKELGITFDQDAADNAALFNDNMKRLKDTFTGVKQTIGNAVIPIFADLSGTFAEAGKAVVEWARNNSDRIRAFAESLISNIGTAIKFTVKAVALMVDAWRGLKMIWNVLKIALAEFAAYMFGVIDRIVEKTLNLMKRLNFKGVFDDQIATVEKFKESNELLIESLKDVSVGAQDELNEVINQGMQIAKVDEFIEHAEERLAEFKDAAITTNEEIKNSTVETNEAIAASNEQTKQKQLTNMELLKQASLDLFGIKTDLMSQESNENESTEKQKFDIKSEFGSRANDLAENLQKATGKRYRALFYMQKAVSASQALISGWAAAISAMQNPPFGYGPVIGKYVGIGIMGMAVANAGLIMAQPFKGSFRDGMDYVPETGSYFLKKGEFVGAPETTRTLNAAIQNGGLGGNGQQVINMQILPNATNLDAMMNMTKNDWRMLVERKISPAMKEVNRLGLGYA